MEPARVLVLLSAALLHSAQCVPAGRGLGLDYGGGVRRARRDVLPYEDRMVSLSVPEEDWRGRGLEQALQRLVERDQRREQQEEQQQRAAYMSAVLQLLADAERAGLVNPELQMELDQDQEEDLNPSEIKTIPDYDDTSPRLTMSRPQAPWWRLVEPQLAEALLQRLDPDFSEALLNKLQETQRSGPRESEQDTLRRLIGQILSSLGPSDSVRPSGRRMRRDLSDSAPSPVSPAHRRSRRSVEDTPPSDDPPLLRVKRLEEEGFEPRPSQGLQRIKRIDVEEDHGSRRRKRRAIVNYDPQILLRQALELIRE
ncbi:proprotein convertase subtilisin/kexin type 1 inhibitor, like [Periophthalmus magnuspinnatus]|uniref:proprotein convertase subtilisin/kexin type 1 inhibitor, like n=1 Tax=Periophthalmus magnuspinnatus TaxID=409849 RepID=UPI00145B69AD|nr:proprotein convertase subtilisin/kexin type 1 inhibitor, like [Periophthalmus magnuspinnatus]